MIPKCVSKKSVKFPGECNLVTCVIDPVDPWLNRQCLSPAELISVYKFQCNLSSIQPLYSVISQLQSIDLRQSLERKHVFNLKGCQLNGGHIDMLEYVFKYVQFQYVNLENTNLDDESVESLYEILSYYETCTGLCLARNPNVTSTGWIPVAFLFREVSEHVVMSITMLRPYNLFWLLERLIYLFFLSHALTLLIIHLSTLTFYMSGYVCTLHIIFVTCL
ncbi:hypothetical protein MS3_00009894 [Schistosoma haematobium]|uniref:Uncharacterized protein n=1 Tax=Schistosoma haematobium TaxID=6185 RepID=A0A922LWX3_SCHHA|nr:hypothetical protein MS3_00009894 [Schistosoma haematobium]KAH9595168.1 hypothetical protein MS3_00009894 [Schistosoma haematobium]